LNVRLKNPFIIRPQWTSPLPLTANNFKDILDSFFFVKQLLSFSVKISQTCYAGLLKTFTYMDAAEMQAAKLTVAKCSNVACHNAISETQQPLSQETTKKVY